MGRSDNNVPRGGDILGLGDVVPGSGAPSHTSQDPEEVRKRRERMREGADDMTPVENDMPPSSGATSIDMGSGGEGTDIE